MGYLYKAFHGCGCVNWNKTMGVMSYFIISLSFCLLECVMVVVSVEPLSQIKGKFYIIQWIVLLLEFLQITFQKDLVQTHYFLVMSKQCMISLQCLMYMYFYSFCRMWFSQHLKVLFVYMFYTIFSKFDIY